MTIKTEGHHAGGFLVSEANKTRSRESITVASGEVLVAGAVLGQITASGLYVELDPDASDGSESAAGILFDAVDASGGDTSGVAIVRDAEVNANELTWPDALATDDQDTATGQLAALGIILR